MIVQPALLRLAVVLEQGQLHAPHRHVQSARVFPQDGQVPVPVGESEAHAAGLLLDRADLEQQLPGTDVDDAVTLRVDQREDRGGGWNADALQPGQQLHSPPLVARAQDLTRCPAYGGRRVAPVMLYRA